MPLQNRVDPWGRIHAVPERGTLMGNRGILHDDHRNISRNWAHRHWVTCVLWPPRRGKRTPMSPGKYTELFFLDEATSLAAGHRPCSGCRREDARRFAVAWEKAIGPARPSKEKIDPCLNAERIGDGKSKRTYLSPLSDLPDGTFVDVDGDAYLLWHDRLRHWTFGGYTDDLARSSAPAEVTVLTPQSLVAVIAVGYTPAVHETA